VILGFSYSLCAASLWPCVPLLVAEERVGTAYAIMNAIQNGGLAIAGVVAGALASCHGTTIHDIEQCTRPPLKFLSLIAVLATCLSFLLLLYDYSHGSVLAKRSARSQVKEEETSLLLNSDSSIST